MKVFYTEIKHIRDCKDLGQERPLMIWTTRVKEAFIAAGSPDGVIVTLTSMKMTGEGDADSPGIIRGGILQPVWQVGIKE